MAIPIWRQISNSAFGLWGAEKIVAKTAAHTDAGGFAAIAMGISNLQSKDQAEISQLGSAAQAFGGLCMVLHTTPTSRRVAGALIAAGSAMNLIQANVANKQARTLLQGGALGAALGGALGGALFTSNLQGAAAGAAIGGVTAYLINRAPSAAPSGPPAPATCNAPSQAPTCGVIANMKNR